MIVDSAHYKDGARQHEGALTPERAASSRNAGGGRVRLDRMHEPEPGDMERLQALFGLHELAVEDAQQAHQRPKIEDYDEDFFIVLKTAHYHEDREEVHFGEIHLFAGAGYVITVRHGPGSELASARQRLEASARSAAARGRVGGVGGPRQGGGRLPPGRRGDRGRHRGGREGGLRRRHPGPDETHLQPEARGDRVPPRRLAAAHATRGPRGGRLPARSRRAAQLLPRRRRSRPPGRRAGQLPARAADQRAQANLALVSVNQNTS